MSFDQRSLLPVAADLDEGNNSQVKSQDDEGCRGNRVDQFDIQHARRRFW